MILYFILVGTLVIGYVAGWHFRGIKEKKQIHNFYLVSTSPPNVHIDKDGVTIRSGNLAPVDESR